jgi:hypothetical protein
VRKRELDSIFPDAAKSYNIDLNQVTLTTVYNFKNICTVLKTTTSLKLLILDFWLDVPYLESLGEAMTKNRSIKTLRLKIDRPIDTEAYQRFSTTITRLKDFVFILKTDDFSNLQVLDSIKGLNMPTRGYELHFATCWDDLASTEIYQKQIEVLRTTNVNKITWKDTFAFFGDFIGLQFNEVGFKEFSEYLVAHDPLKKFSSEVSLNGYVVPYLANVLRASRNLHHLEIDLKPEQQSNLADLFDGLAKSPLKYLYLQLSSVEKLLEMAETIRSMEKLTAVSLRFLVPIDEESFKQFMQSLGGSESIRTCQVNSHNQPKKFSEQCNEISYRNRRLQNTRVADLLTILFNIARDTSSPSSSSAHIHSIPRDVWPSIASFVSIPGVNLDFGDIARSIFKDHTVGRVINKPPKTLRHVPKPKQ